MTQPLVMSCLGQIKLPGSCFHGTISSCIVSVQQRSTLEMDGSNLDGDARVYNTLVHLLGQLGLNPVINPPQPAVGDIHALMRSPWLFSQQDRAVQVLRALVGEEGFRRACAAFPTPIDTLLMLDEEWGMQLIMTGPFLSTMTQAPTLIRTLAAAGCPVSRQLPDSATGASGTLSTLDNWLQTLDRFELVWADSVNLNTDGVTRALLQCAAEEEDSARPPIVTAAMATGSRRLVEAVQAALPNFTGDALLRLAAEELARILRTIPMPPMLAGLEEHDQACISSFYAVMSALLEAGCAPVRLELRPLLPRVPEAPGQPRLQGGSSAPLILHVPAWALEPLRYLPMVAGDLPYCPEHYAAFPHAFQRTARALLLINECRGFGVLSVASRAEVGAGSGEAQGWSGVRLPMGELLHILGLAAKPLHVWQGL